MSDRLRNFHRTPVALWAIENSNSFEEGMLKVVNLGGDADTAGAVFGQLSGATYGVDAIPDRWKKKSLSKRRNRKNRTSFD